MVKDRFTRENETRRTGMRMSGVQPRPRWATFPRRQRFIARRAGALASLSCLVIGVSACGNWISVTYAGQVGITVDQAGQPVIAVMTCSKATPVIEMSEGRKKSDPDHTPNVQRGGWKARRAFAGVDKIALAAPGENWVTTRDPGALELDRLFVVDGGTIEDKTASLGGVSFHRQDLARLSPNQVQVDGKVESLTTFGAYQCH
jgi:hypothetical protein